VQARDCGAPCLTNLSKLGSSTTLLNKISSAEVAGASHQFERRIHGNLQLFV
jgi:hypothetical protein